MPDDLTSRAVTPFDPLARFSVATRPVSARNTPPSLNGRLSWLVAASLLPLVALLVGLVFANYRVERAAAARQVQDKARSLALAVERELRSTVSSLEALALSPSLQKGDLAAFRVEAETLAAHHFPGASVALLEPDGNQLLNTFKPPGTPLPRRPNTTALDEVVATRAPVVSDMFEATLQRMPIVPVDVPVFGTDGTVSAIVSLAPPLAVFAEIIRQQRPDPDWVVAVLDRRGTVVSRTRSPEKFVGKPAMANLIALMEATAEGTAETTSLDGIPLLTGWSRPGSTGWGVAVGAPRTELFAPLWRALATTMALCAAAFLSALGLARWVAGRIARPIGRLVALAADPADRLETRDTLGLREADAVAAALRAANRERQAAEGGLRAEQARGRTELEQRVEERTRELRTAQADLLQAQRMEALGQLTAGIAHDFNNLLQTQTASLELLQKAVQGQEKPARYASVAFEAAGKAAKLVHSLLAFSRKQMLQPQVVDVPPLVNGLREMLSRVLDPRVVLQVDLAPGLPTLFADPAQLEAALLNLCLNGRDAMQEKGGLLLIEASDGAAVTDGPDLICRGGCIVISVSDQGTGMDAETAARACEPFFTTKPVGKGSGLGLSMVQGFARQSGGELRIRSAPGEGTRIELWLPRASAQSRPIVPMAVEGKQPAVAERAAPAGRVLLVDDEPALANAVGELLSGAGFRVTLAASGDEALALLRSGTLFDAVVSDHAMPGMTGGEMLRRARDLFPDLPGLIVTGFADVGRAGSVPGDIQVLYKPFGSDDLLGWLRAAVRDRGKLAIDDRSLGTS